MAYGEEKISWFHNEKKINFFRTRPTSHASAENIRKFKTCFKDDYIVVSYILKKHKLALYKLGRGEIENYPLDSDYATHIFQIK